MKTGDQYGLAFSAMQSMNIRRIEAGILDSGSDFDSSITPFEAGLERFIDLEKEDFIGRQALMATKQRQRIFGLRCEGAIPSGGDIVKDLRKRSARALELSRLALNHPIWVAESAKFGLINRATGPASR